MSLKEQLVLKIKSNRPKLSDSSIKTYVSIFTNICKSLKSDNQDLSWFSENYKQIIEYLKDKTDTTNKTALSALYILTEKPEYREIMMTIMKTVNLVAKEQKKDVKQELNWISTAEIKTIYNKLLTKANSMLSNKQIFNQPTMMEFLLLAFLGGVSGIAPRRSFDYALLKISLASLNLVCLLSSLKLCYQMKIRRYNFCGMKITRDIKLEIEEDNQTYDRVPASKRNSLLPF